MPATMDKPKTPQKKQGVMCGSSYITQPYGGGTRYACPNCDVRRNDYGIPFVSWTNGHITRRFCNNINISTK